MAAYRILSMDGGGIRGIVTARLLERIVEQRPGFLDRTDLFAGTSTGAILAVALARGVRNPESALTPTEMVALYRSRGQEIFHTDLLHELGGLWGLTGAKYSTENRRDVIHSAIGDFTLDQLLPRHVIVASFQLDGGSDVVIKPAAQPQAWKAKFFHNFEGPDSDGAENAIDVILRSSAAPTYFPIYQGFIDGGVVANNPSICALAQAINPSAGGKQDLHDVVLMSVGTGARAKSIRSQDGNWGIQQWGFNLLDLLLESGAGLADYQCRQLLGDCYRRINPDLGEDIGLDRVDRIDLLLRQASAYDLTELLAWIDARWLA